MLAGVFEPTLHSFYTVSVPLVGVGRGVAPCASTSLDGLRRQTPDEDVTIAWPDSTIRSSWENSGRLRGNRVASGPRYLRTAAVQLRTTISGAVPPICFGVVVTRKRWPSLFTA